MKWILCGAFLMGIVLSSGCTAPISSSMAPVPDLTGNWSGPMKGYIEGTGYVEASKNGMTLVISEQNDRFFAGQMIFSSASGATRTEGFSGVIGRDGTSLTIVEHGSGHCSGTLVSSEEIELIFTDDSDPSRIAIDSLKRVP